MEADGRPWALTLAGLVSTCRLMSRLAAAAPDGHHPFAFSIAMQSWGAAPSLAPHTILLWLCMSHTGACSCHQGSTPSPTGLGFRKGGKSPKHSGASIGEELDCYEGQAGASVLEGHIEATLGERAEAALFDIQLQPCPLPCPVGSHCPCGSGGGGGRETLIGCYRVHLGPALEVPGWGAVRAVGLFCLAVV